MPHEAKKTINAGGRQIPNPEYLGLGKRLKPLMDKISELQHAVQESQRAYKEYDKLRDEIKAAPSKYKHVRAEALLRGEMATALADPAEPLKEQAREKWAAYELWHDVIRRRILREIADLIPEHPEWLEAVENRAMQDAEQEQKLRSELNQVAADREQAYKLLDFLRRTDRLVR